MRQMLVLSMNVVKTMPWTINFGIVTIPGIYRNIESVINWKPSSFGFEYHMKKNTGNMRLNKLGFDQQSCWILGFLRNKNWGASG